MVSCLLHSTWYPPPASTYNRMLVGGGGGELSPLPQLTMTLVERLAALATNRPPLCPTPITKEESTPALLVSSSFRRAPEYSPDLSQLSQGHWSYFRLLSICHLPHLTYLLATIRSTFKKIQDMTTSATFPTAT